MLLKDSSMKRLPRSKKSLLRVMSPFAYPSEKDLQSVDHDEWQDGDIVDVTLPCPVGLHWSGCCYTVTADAARLLFAGDPCALR